MIGLIVLSSLLTFLLQKLNCGISYKPHENVLNQWPYLPKVTKAIFFLDSLELLTYRDLYIVSSSS